MKSTILFLLGVALVDARVPTCLGDEICRTPGCAPSSVVFTVRVKPPQGGGSGDGAGAGGDNNNGCNGGGQQSHHNPIMVGGNGQLHGGVHFTRNDPCLKKKATDYVYRLDSSLLHDGGSYRNRTTQCNAHAPTVKSCKDFVRFLRDNGVHADSCDMSCANPDVYRYKGEKDCTIVGCQDGFTIVAHNQCGACKGLTAKPLPPTSQRMAIYGCYLDRGKKVNGFKSYQNPKTKTYLYLQMSSGTTPQWVFAQRIGSGFRAYANGPGAAGPGSFDFVDWNFYEPKYKGYRRYSTPKPYQMIKGGKGDCFALFRGQDCPGNDLTGGHTIQPNTGACQKHCASTPHCNYFTYVTASKKCYLKTDCQLRKAKAGLVSGRYRCWGEGPTRCPTTKCLGENYCFGCTSCSSCHPGCTHDTSGDGITHHDSCVDPEDSGAVIVHGRNLRYNN